MPDGYLDLPFPDQGDPALKRQRFIEKLEDGVPGYVAVDGHPLVIAGEGTGEMAADNETLAQNVARAVFRAYGRFMVGLPAIEATHATALVTISGDPDYTVDAGAQIAIGNQTFILENAVTLDGSGTATGAVFTAFDEGEAASGLTNTPQPITALASVTGYSLDEATSGGHEAETDDEYENRLARRQRTQGRPELAEDFAERMLENPEVFSALVLDGYNADDTTSGNDATVTLVARNSAGLPVSTDAKDERKAAILAEKTSGWNVFVIDPTYTRVAGAATVSVWPGYDDTATKAAAAAALAMFLDPAGWGSTPTGEIVDWNQEPTVLRSEVITALNNVQGVRHVTNLVLGTSLPVTADAASNVLTSAGHGYSNTDQVRFSGLTGGSPLVEGTVYYARDVTTNTFKVAATSGGAAIDLTTDITVGRVQHLADQDVALAGVAKLPLPGPVWIS